MGFAMVAPLLACDPTAPVVPKTVTVSFTAAQLERGDTIRASASAQDAAGKPLTGLPVTWTSGSNTIATVDSTGLVTGMAQGGVTIYASVKGVQSGAPLTVIVTVSTVNVTMPSPVDVGDSTQTTVAAVSAKGFPVIGRPVSYGTSDSTVAKVNSAGYVRGMGAGAATITATVDGIPGSAPVTVTVAPASVEITPASPNLAVNGTAQLTATARDGANAPIAGRTFTWTSSDPARVSVSSSGLVTWRAPGPATITAKTGPTFSTTKATAAGDFKITGVHLTQGVQDADGTMPMVVGDAPAAVLVFLTAPARVTASMRLVLRVLNDNGTLAYSDTTTVTDPIDVSTSLAFPSAKFLLPTAQIHSGLKWQVLRDPTGVTPDDSAASDIFPRGAPATLTVHYAPPLLVRFVPIVLAAHNNTAPTISQSDLGEYLRTVRSSVPVGPITATIATGFTTSASFGTPPSSGGGSAFWQQVLSELDAARVSDNSDDPATHWMGVVSPPAGFNFTQYGGFGYVPPNPQTTGPFTRTALGVRTGWFSNQTQARDNIAHELGHNFGRQHSPCGGAGGPDPNYPQTDGRLGQLMHDVYSWSGNPLSALSTIAASNGDLMSYCFPLWSSVYTYSGIISARGTIVAGAPAATVTDVIAIQGSIPLDGNASPRLLPTLALRGRPTRPAPGDHHLLGYDDTGQLLFDHAFAATPVDHAPVALFTFALPVDATTQRLARLRVTGPTGTATLTEFVPFAQGTSDVRRDANGAVAVNCNDASARVAVQDAVTGRLLGISSRGTMTIATSARRVAVSCGRGVRPARREFVLP
jgi:uncharacterized protein YjdB